MLFPHKNLVVGSINCNKSVVISINYFIHVDHF